MQIAVLTFDAFNELDSFISAGILNRMKSRGWKAYITSPTPTVTSMNGVTVHAERDLAFASEADVVLIGSGARTRELVKDANLLSRIKLDPTRQLIGAQCSGTLTLAKLGLLGDCPACTDVISKPWVIEAGVRVLDQPFFAQGNVATAGGCLAQQYLAAWVLLRKASREDAEFALTYAAPVGEKAAYLERAIANVEPYLTPAAAGESATRLPEPRQAASASSLSAQPQSRA